MDCADRLARVSTVIGKTVSYGTFKIGEMNGQGDHKVSELLQSSSFPSELMVSPMLFTEIKIDISYVRKKTA